MLVFDIYTISEPRLGKWGLPSWLDYKIMVAAVIFICCQFILLIFKGSNRCTTCLSDFRILYMMNMKTYRDIILMVTMV